MLAYTTIYILFWSLNVILFVLFRLDSRNILETLLDYLQKTDSVIRSRGASIPYTSE